MSLTLHGYVLLLCNRDNIVNNNRKKIYQYLLQGISQGEYAQNDRIPTEQELGDMFSAHRLDAHYAVKQLHQMGILRRNRKQGTYVEKIPTPYQMGELKSLGTRRVCVLNTIHPDYQHIHWNQRLISPLEDALNGQKIEVQFENVSALKSPGECRDFMSDLIAHGFNALVLIPQCTQDNSEPISSQPELLFEFHNNVFIFDRGVHHWNDWPYNMVSINVFGEGAMVAKYLTDQKIKHIIFCCQFDRIDSWQRERQNGLKYGLYRETQGEQSLICHDYHRHQPNTEFFINIRDFIANGSTALVAENDETAVDILESAKKLGLVAGVDYSLIGFDDNSKYQSYNLTTVSPSLERIGKTLGCMIQQSLNHSVETSDVTCTRVNSELKIRATG